MTITEFFKNLLWTLFGLGAVGGMVYMGAGTFPTVAPEITPFPVNKELVEFYTAACDIQVFTNQNKSLNTVEYLINASEMTGDPSGFTYATMTRASDDWSRWSAGALQGTAYWCYIHVVQNEPLGATNNFYFNFTRSPNTNLVGDVTWSSGHYSGTYNYRSLTITGPVTFSGNTTITTLENITITAPNGQITINSANPAYTISFSSYTFINQGTIQGYGTNGAGGGCGCYMTDCGMGYGCVGAYCNTGGTGNDGPNFVFNVSSFRNTGNLITNGGTGGDSCGTVYSCNICSGTGGLGGNGGTVTFNPVATFNNSGVISMVGNTGGTGPSHWLYTGRGGNGGKGGNFSRQFLYFTNTGTISTNGGAPGTGYYGGVGGNGGVNIVNVSSNITVTNVMTANQGSGGTAGSWTIPYCANGTGMDWTKIAPTATTSSTACLAKPTTSFLSPNNTTSLLTLSNNLAVNLSTNATELSYRYQLSLNNGSTWVYVPEAVAPIPAYFNRTAVFDIYLMNATPQAMMRVLAFNNTSKIYGEWTNSQSFYLLNRNTTLINTTSPTTITSTPFTIYCNYTSNGTVLQDAAVQAYIDGVPYNTTYDSATKL